MALDGELAKGALSLELDDDDLEMSLLRRRLAPALRDNEGPNIADLTRLAYEVIGEDLRRVLALTVNRERCGYAVLTGIQVHTPLPGDFIWPGECCALVGKRRQDLSLGVE